MFDARGHEPTTRTCAICGHAIFDAIEWTIVRYRGGENPPYKAVYRCTDREACRRRLDRIGKRWPLLEPGESTKPGRPIEVARASGPAERDAP